MFQEIIVVSSEDVLDVDEELAIAAIHLVGMRQKNIRRTLKDQVEADSRLVNVVDALLIASLSLKECGVSRENIPMQGNCILENAHDLLGDGKGSTIVNLLDKKVDHGGNVVGWVVHAGIIASPFFLSSP
jgi:hypothetical protein